MDKTKSEKLKEILNQKLSSDEIERKLKEEVKAINEKKEIKSNKLQEENQENEKIREEVKQLEEQIEKKEIEEPKQEEVQKKQEKKEKVVIPTVRDKETENSESNLLLYLVSIIAILLLTLTIYLFTKDEPSRVIKESSKKELVENIDENKPEIKEVVNEEITKVLEIKKNVLQNIDDNKSEIKQTPSKEINLQAVETEKKNEKLEENVIKEEPNNDSNKKEDIVIKEKIVTKIVNLDKKDFKKYYNSSKYNTLKCYNFKAGDIFPDAQCKKDLVKFIEANKNAIRFEVIPVIAKDDNRIFTKIEPNIKGLEQSFQDRVKEYMFRGLGRERVLETSWQIKDILGEDTVLTPTNYYVKSKKNNKGIIIKAYH